jgi:hypothetical protein
VWAESEYNDGTTKIKSNLLYYKFVVKSSVVGVMYKHTPFFKSIEKGGFPINQFYISCQQHTPVQLNWGYFTDSDSRDTQIPIQWKIVDENNTVITTLNTITASSGYEASQLNFIPTIYTQDGQTTYLASYYRDTQLDKIEI